MTMITLNTAARDKFAALLRDARRTRTLRVYGRFGVFGRALITDSLHVIYPACAITVPSMNIHKSR